MSCGGDDLGINVRELIRLANHHPRVNVLQPGCGVGGHCIAVDPWFIAAAAPLHPLIQSARRVNDGKSRWVIERVQAVPLPWKISLVVRPASDASVWPSTRMWMICASPALRITTELLVAGLEVLACEPNLSDHSTIKLTRSSRSWLKRICLCFWWPTALQGPGSLWSCRV